MKKIETMHDAFVHELSDMNNAEKQLTKALPKMAKAASNEKLSQAFETHLKETEGQIKLIEKVVKLCKIKLNREKCDAMEGLIKEGSQVIKEVDEGPVRDAMLIAAAQKVEHYEIASYGCLVAAAEQLGFPEAAELLEQILDQEKQTDQKLNQLAMNEINDDAQEQQDSTLQKGKAMARYDQERQGNGSRSRGGRNMPERDEEGRFMSDEDDDRGSSARGGNGGRNSSRSRSRDDYEDDRGSPRSGRGGSSMRSGGNSRYDDDDVRSHGRSGWFGDSEGHSEASRRGWQNSDHGDSGWYGDSEGHAEAARRGWEDRDDRGRSASRSRSSSRYEDEDDSRSGGGRSSSSRSRSSREDYDDDRSSSRGRSSGRGQGGWFGDSEGHSQAARQRWEGRR